LRSLAVHLPSQLTDPAVLDDEKLLELDNLPTKELITILQGSLSVLGSLRPSGITDIWGLEESGGFQGEPVKDRGSSGLSGQAARILAAV